jgi:hypothetical protein
LPSRKPTGRSSGDIAAKYIGPRDTLANSARHQLVNWTIRAHLDLIMKAGARCETCTVNIPKPQRSIPITTERRTFEVRDQVLFTRGRQRACSAGAGRRFKRYVWVRRTSPDVRGTPGGELPPTQRRRNSSPDPEGAIRGNGNWAETADGVITGASEWGTVMLCDQ